MAPRVQIKRTSTPGSQPNGLLPGELAVEMDTPTRLWVGVPALQDASLKKLLADPAATDAAIAAAVSDRVFRTGDTMTGNLTIRVNYATLSLDKTGSGEFCSIQSYTLGVLRWNLRCGDTLPESGANSGSDWTLQRFADDGAYLGNAFTVSRATGHLTLYTEPVDPIHAATKKYVDDQIALCVKKAGDIMTGTLTIDPTPDAPFIICNYNGAMVATINPAGDIFCTQQVNIARSTSGAQLPGFNFSPNGWATTDGGLGYDPATQSLILGVGTVGNRLELRPNGDLYITGVTATKQVAGDWAAPSDARIKDVTGRYEPGLAELKTLNPVRYQFKGNDTADAPTKSEAPYDESPHAQLLGQEFVGLIAQDAEKALPETVGKEAGFINGAPVDDLRTYNSSNILYALLNACKELSARVESLEAQIAQPR